MFWRPCPHCFLLLEYLSLLRIPFKILEKLIYARADPIIDPLLPQEQAGF